MRTEDKKNKRIYSAYKRTILVLSAIVCVLSVSLIYGTISDETGYEEPVKNSSAAQIVTEKELIPCGQSIGVKMDVGGVLIVGLEEIEAITGDRINPGLIAGLQIGDSILEINGHKVKNAQDVESIVNQTKTQVLVTVLRKENRLNFIIMPVLAKNDQKYKLGIWVKEKTAGIGTLTFYDPQTKCYGALGHGITDPESGAILDVEYGELLNSKIESVKQGKAGEPGEIRGIFYNTDAPLGTLNKNTDFGVFGKLYNSQSIDISKSMKICKKEQIKTGKAYIMTTLDSNKVETFEIEIEKINTQKEPNSKSMIIEVTDPELIRRSGGIVQGMSGSPIIQDDKIVGAVTHVFVNNPKKGYGVFIEWMVNEEVNLSKNVE